MNLFRASHLVALAPLFIGCVGAGEVGEESTEETTQAISTTIPVSGTGVDLLNGAIVHSQVFTDTTLTMQSTETVELSGDLHGRVLYHVTTFIDFVAGTLQNSGDQVFSGTIAGSAPTLIYDNEFVFNVNLVTGEETGQVYLVHRLAGAKARCVLDVLGTGVTPEGNPTFSYTGECTIVTGE